MKRLRECGCQVAKLLAHSADAGADETGSTDSFVRLHMFRCATNCAGNDDNESIGSSGLGRTQKIKRTKQMCAVQCASAQSYIIVRACIYLTSSTVGRSFGWSNGLMAKQIRFLFALSAVVHQTHTHTLDKHRSILQPCANVDASYQVGRRRTARTPHSLMERRRYRHVAVETSSTSSSSTFRSMF